MIDVGNGPPIVMIPGIQGRWEWMGPAIRAVSTRCRVLSFSYDRTPGSKTQRNTGTLDRLVDQVVEIMDAAGVERAAVCGVSFGGFIATRFAARFPERTQALILVSSPTPRWAPDETLLKYMETPLLSLPLVMPVWFLRLWPEIVAAKPSVIERVRFGCEYAGRALRSPLSVTKMSEWATLKIATDIVADCARVTAPALLITGEPSLDRVVDLRKSQDYVTLIPGTRHVTIERTGHIGLVSKPETFAGLVCGFIAARGSGPGTAGQRRAEREVRVDIQGPAGHLEGILDAPPGAPKAAVVFAHPLPTEGGTMHTKAVFQGTKGLVRIGCAVLRFNFRGVGKSEGTFNEGRGERDDVRAALDFMTARYPETPLWAAGFSFGSNVALETGAADERVSVLIGIAPPVTREGYDFSNTIASTKPKFFIQGSEDEICPLEAMWAFYGTLQEPKELVVIDGADHLFTGQAPEVGEALQDLLGDFE